VGAGIGDKDKQGFMKLQASVEAGFQPYQRVRLNQ
jgi:hypothetical protein